LEYCPGRLNTVADALSRRDGDVLLLAVLALPDQTAGEVSMPTFQLFADLRRELDASIELRAYQDTVAAGDYGDS
jgi:hypothetical protein